MIPIFWQLMEVRGLGEITASGGLNEIRFFLIQIFVFLSASAALALSDIPWNGPIGK